MTNDDPAHEMLVVRFTGRIYGADGQIDVPAATQMMTDVIEGWIREHPGQYLWFHRRWR